MNEELELKLRKYLAVFIEQNDLSPTTVDISFSPSRVLIVLDIHAE